ncbi:MAG: MlaD family protein [Lentisphaerota bacterium]
MKKSRLQETSVEITVGAFMFMILMVLGVFTIILSRENLFAKTYMVNVVFDNVMGLREGDNVFVRGVDIGKIKSIKIESDGVHILAALEQESHLREDYRIEILPSSVLGGRYLNINEGSERLPLLAPGTKILGQSPVDLIEQATKTIESVRQALDEGGILENLKVVMAQFKEVTTKLSTGEGTLGKLLMDDKVYNDLEQVASNLKTISQNLADGKGTLGHLLSDDDQMYRDLSEAVVSIKNITKSIENGEGTIGKLTKDDSLYTDAKVVLKEIQAAIDDIRESTPISTFTSVFFGAF